MAPVAVAKCGATALSQLESFHPDVGVLDLSLDDMRGVDPGRRLRELVTTSPLMPDVHPHALKGANMLQGLPGVGQALADRLLRHFGTEVAPLLQSRNASNPLFTGMRASGRVSRPDPVPTFRRHDTTARRARAC